MEDPATLLARLKLGREEYCQRLLTMLIVDGEYPRWNSQNAVSRLGRDFLRDLDELSFRSPETSAPLTFIDEFDLPRRRDVERGGAPDSAVLWSDRVWLIELKTEQASHRRDQIPYYFELGAHHHPGVRLDITYLTPPLSMTQVLLGTEQRFAHVSWSAVLPLVDQTWGHGTAAQRSAVRTLTEVLNDLGTPWSQWRERKVASQALPTSAVPDAPASAAPDAVAEPLPEPAFDYLLEIAARTAQDGQQRAAELEPTSLEELKELRLALRDLLVLRDSPVRPWLWNSQTSGGKALTSGGAEVGYELRFSRQRAGGDEVGGPVHD